MSMMIYLSNQTMQFVVGKQGKNKISADSYFSVNVPEGCVLNGIFMDLELFEGFIRDLWKEKKLPTTDVYLVVNSTKFVGRKIDLPKLNQKKTVEYLIREYSDVDQADKMVYSYVPLATEDPQMQRVYAEAVSPEYIKDFVDVFTGIGVKLKGIYTGEGSIINFVGKTLDKKYKTFVLEIAGRMTLTTILWVNGTFYYYNNVRCFHEKGSEDYAMDLARSVSQIKQFMMANQIEASLECIVVAGIDDDFQNATMEAMMMQGIQEPVQLYSKLSIPQVQYKGDAGNMLYPLSAFFYGGEARNLLTEYRKTAKNEKKKLSKYGILIAAVAFIMVAGAIGSFVLRQQQEKELQKLIDENNSVEVQMDIAQYNVLSARNNFLFAQYDSIDTINENIKTYPTCNHSVVAVLEECAEGLAEIEISAFDAEAGTVNMTAAAEDVERINQYISRLLKQDIFSKVDYTGYRYSEGEKKWDINVTCILAEAAGKQVE